MELSWPTHRQVVYGPHLGYGAANVKLREAMGGIGVGITKRSKTIVHLCRPDVFKPIKKRKNILFTMYEGYPVPEEFAKSFKRADLLLTPSSFCKEMFDPLCDGKKFAVVPLGFDDAIYRYSPRSWCDGDQFVWLWVGAPNARKGWDVLLRCWSDFFEGVTWMRLIMKTTATEGEGEVKTLGNVTFDSRRYTEEGLADLYSKCDAFVLPTAGEGWGLTILEALVSGLPIVTTTHGGQMDFLNEDFAYFANHEIKEVVTTEGSKFNAAIADPNDLARKMLQVVSDYPKATRMAKLGSDNAVKNFTWANSASKVKELILNKFGER